MLSQCSLPMAALGRMRGLTLQRLFDKALTSSAPNLFVSSFNKHFGGPAAASCRLQPGLQHRAATGPAAQERLGGHLRHGVQPLRGAHRGGRRLLVADGVKLRAIVEGSQDLPGCTGGVVLQLDSHGHLRPHVVALSRSSPSGSILTSSKLEKDTLIQKRWFVLNYNWFFRLLPEYHIHGRT
ncbi:unnamed protein product [Polarella glacialis]|uniref:Uncharacterized protein n=1 Tax=Polarella glacialis TaxID=89957 RepID=A0A813G2A5_POLGL|nr:unnamed protein product [Polarella glacialis]CAE8684569.1 unnamed protein product [Polarella glacialis]